MADTRIQLEVEDWVRRNWMPAHFGTKFSRERLPLRSGGVFDFDAVSDDRSIVATISTSGSKTSGGKHAVGKILKLRSDIDINGGHAANCVPGPYIGLLEYLPSSATLSYRVSDKLPSICFH